MESIKKENAENKIRQTLRESFIAPLEIIEQAIQLIIDGEIGNYKFEINNRIIENI